MSPPTIAARSFAGVLLVALAAAANGPAAARDQAPNAAAAQVDRIFAAFDNPDSPGCALAVIRDGQIAYARGYGMADLDHDIPITPSSVFHVASVSKQFTAMAVLLLEREGKLALDDEVRKYVPELRGVSAPITIRHLMHHVSGLRDQWDLLIMSGWRLSQDVVREQDVLDLVSRMTALNFPPGSRYLYSNTGYTLLAVIVARVTGLSFREFTEEHIFRPLGMTRTFFRDDHRAIVKHQAYAYARRQDGSFRLSVPTYDTVGASSLLTTVEDLAKWDRNFNDPRVGDRALLEQMHVRATLTDGEPTTYAAGQQIGTYRGLPIVEHAGGDAGYRSHLMRFPGERFSIACLCNAGSANPGQLARQVADLHLGPRFPEPAPATTSATRGVTLTAAQLADLVGSYWSAATEELARTRLAGGHLQLSFSGFTGMLVPVSAARFRFDSQPAEVLFDATAPDAGAPSTLVVHRDGSKPTRFDRQAPFSPTPAQLAEFSGSYYSAEIDSAYRFDVLDGELLLHRKKQAPAVLQPVFPDAFGGNGMGFASHATAIAACLV
ncbi:MAG: serine hydrolase domain-containing protein [Acidobacteriota bacterium]